MSKRVAIIDYEAGNLFSVERACQKVGLKTFVTRDPGALRNADAAILPGVGAFGEASTRIRSMQLEAPILEFIEQGKAFLGVCLGLQLLFASSTEFGEHKGLGVFRGKIVKFEPTASSSFSSTAQKFPVPQIGWNKIQPASQAWTGTPLQDCSDGDYMYFVHSFYAVPDDSAQVLCQTTYAGITYCSGVRRDNVTAFQFHPEKSGAAGLQIYQNWANSI